MIKPENLASILRERVREFGKMPAYILSSDELVAGAEHAILSVQQSEDCGDGTLITKAIFEGNTFINITEKK